MPIEFEFLLIYLCSFLAGVCVALLIMQRADARHAVRSVRFRRMLQR